MASSKASALEIICSDLLPPSYHDMILDSKNVLSALKLLYFILDEIIQSQTILLQNNQTHFFEPHLNESCCAIRAVNLLLSETKSLKTAFEARYQIEYLHNRKSQVNQKIQFFTKEKNASQIDSTQSLMQFLEKNELIFVISVIDKYIFVSYFLESFKKKNGEDNQILFDYYRTLIPKLCRDVIIQVSRDISDRKKSEESLQLAKKQAEAANRAKTEFLENMRHDIRTPLTGIIGFARLIQQEAISQRTKEYADNLVRATSALLDFQNEILDVIKISKNAEPVAQETFNLKNIAEKVLNLVRPKAIVKKLELTFSADSALPAYVLGDSKRLFRILLELVTNALKFTATGKINICFTAEKINHDQLLLRCEVSDTGIGIPHDKKDDIFIRFHRLSPSSDGVYEGTGLGLTVVKKYVKDLSGKISVTSKLNEGTTITCLIPLRIAKEMKDEKSIAPFHSKILFKPKRVLLVEDHSMTATVTQLLLTELNCTVELASDGKTAYEQFCSNHYDLILMDLGLPDCNGFELSKKIRQHEKTTGFYTKIIALTAHREEDNATRCINSGMDAIFQKPLLKETAMAILNTYFSDEAMDKKIIDLALGAKRVGRDEIAAKSMLDLLMKSINDDQKNIENALNQNNYQKLHDANHKLIGGLAYCGAPRLEEACQQLQSALKNLNKEQISHFAKSVLTEINALKLAANSS